MRIIPAIDLLEGKAVRLREGKRDTATVYSDEPWKLAAEFAQQGARTLHVVDLDGAFAGARRHTGVIARIVEAFAADDRHVQVGGGIRDEASIAEVMGAGVRWAVLGTAAAKNPNLVIRACETYPDRIIVAVDADKGGVRVDGWAKSSNLDPVELALRAAIWGASRILYTDITRDGTKVGPNAEATARLQRLVGQDTPVIASGGIGSLEDVRTLFRAGIQQCVIGRALYDGAFTLPAALAAVGIRTGA